MKQHNIYPKTIGDRIDYTKKTTDETSKNLLILQENTHVKQIQNIAQILFNTKDGLFNACYYTRYPKQCSDGSTLYTILKIDNKNILIPVGAGEFNTEVFNQQEVNKINRDTGKQNDYSNIKGFSKTPIPLFVVNQVDSIFANEKQRNNIINNPIEYLQNNSIIVIPKIKQAYIRTNDQSINFNDINILPENIAIKKLQSALFETKISQKELLEIKNYMQQRQTKTLEEFDRTIKYIKKNISNIKDNPILEKLIFLLENMLKNKGDIQEMYNLVISYNKNKEIFE